MPIRVDCTACRKWYKAPSKAAGRKVKCPGCGAELTVPTTVAEEVDASPRPTTLPKPPTPPAARQTSSPPATNPVATDPDLPPLAGDDWPDAPWETSPDAVSTPASIGPRRPVRRGRNLQGGVQGMRDWGLRHPLITTVGVMACLLMLAGILRGGGWLATGAGMAVAGAMLVAVGLILPSSGNPKRKSRPATRSSPRPSGGASPLGSGGAAGGALGLLGLLGIAIRFLGRGRRALNNAADRAAETLDRAAARTEDAATTVMIHERPGIDRTGSWLAGLGVIAVLIVILVGLFLLVRRYGLFRVFAPIYLFFGGLVLLSAMVLGASSSSARSRLGEPLPGAVPTVTSVTSVPTSPSPDASPTPGERFDVAPAAAPPVATPATTPALPVPPTHNRFNHDVIATLRLGLSEPRLQIDGVVVAGPDARLLELVRFSTALQRPMVNAAIAMGVEGNHDRVTAAVIRRSTSGLMPRRQMASHDIRMAGGGIAERLLGGISTRATRGDFGYWGYDLLEAQHRDERAVVFTVGTKRQEILESARRLQAELLITIHSGATGPTTGTPEEVSLSIRDVESDALLWKSKGIRSMGLMPFTTPDTDPAVAIIEEALEFLDGQQRLGPIPPLDSTHAAGRAAEIVATKAADPLTVLLELRSFQAQGLLTADEAAGFYGRVLDAERGRLLASPSEEDRRRAIENLIRWQP